MKALKYILLLVLILIIGCSIYIATLNGEYDIQSKKTIKAPSEVIFNNINDFKNWKDWGPWYEMDSTIVASYPEITSGEGASYSWTGKDGAGSMKTLSLIPNKELIQEIQFSQGSPSEVYWDITRTDYGNEVTWGMKGKSTFGEKIYWLTQGGIEKNLKPMFDRGLELLDAHLLKEMDKHSFDFKGAVDHGGGYYLYQTTSCKIEQSDKKMQEMLTAVIGYVKENEIQSYGKPFLITHKWDEVNKTTMFSVCYPINERLETTGDILTGYLKPQKTFKTVFKGNYKYSELAWNSAFQELAKQGFKFIDTSEPFEVYLVSPRETENPAHWVTEIYLPIE
ncbi:GyrI-like domain-containing protein [uncultured Lutibacter sp.]|uniref:SRPBCC family protein n=1 Tax=uncultured Lutibacter sp. TaxID=437739 RepID=UPI0026212BD9|nr:GyrI-like domain-containing protein [uncultured Lutibacter sp.]